MNSKILLSICVPTCNRPEFLKRNLISVLNQITKEVELLVSDDSESDESAVLVDQLNPTNDNHIKYIKNISARDVPFEERQAYNVNKLIERAEGTFIYILHDDDFLITGALSNITTVLNTHMNHFKVFMFGTRIVDKYGNIKKIQRKNRDKTYSNKEAVKTLLSDSSFVRTPGIVIKKEVYNKVGSYNPDLEIPIDFDMWTRIFPNNDLFYSSHIIANYSEHGGNQTESIFTEKYLRIIYESIEKLRHYNFFEKKRFDRLKSKFLHRWILAGIYRCLKKNEYQKAKKCYELFELKETRNMTVPVKWIPVKFLFFLILRFKS